MLCIFISKEGNTMKLEKAIKEIESGKMDAMRFTNIVDENNDEQDLVIFSKRLLDKINLERYIRVLKSERQKMLVAKDDTKFHTLFIDRLKIILKEYKEGKEIFILSWNFYDILFGHLG